MGSVGAASHHPRPPTLYPTFPIIVYAACGYTHARGAYTHLAIVQKEVRPALAVGLAQLSHVRLVAPRQSVAVVLAGGTLLLRDRLQADLVTVALDAQAAQTARELDATVHVTRSLAGVPVGAVVLRRREEGAKLLHVGKEEAARVWKHV